MKNLDAPDSKVHYRNPQLEMQGIIFVLIRPPRRLRSSEVFARLGRGLFPGCAFVLTASLLAGCERQMAEAVFGTPQGPKRVTLECATTLIERSRGLMFRNDLEEDHGMLFVFPEETLPSFWMKHTFLSLDILFLSRDGLVVDVAERLLPCAADPCPLYQARAPSRYALELKGGFSAKHKIKIGDRVKLTLPLDSSCSGRQQK